MFRHRVNGTPSYYIPLIDAGAPESEDVVMIGRRNRQTKAPSGYFQFSSFEHLTISGYGEGDFVRLKDEQGHVWLGIADVRDDRSVFYRFRRGDGKVISGVSDGYGIVLRDERGQTWRGYVF